MTGDIYFCDVIHKAIIEEDEKETKVTDGIAITFYIIDEEKGITLFSSKFEVK